jgi:hypothetical protein
MQIEEESKVIEIAIKERIFVIPFYLKAGAVSEAVNLMGRRRMFMLVYHEPGIEPPLLPTAGLKLMVKCSRDL